MLNNKILHYIFIIILLFSYGNFRPNIAYAQNSSAYNGIRNTTGANCNADLSDEEDLDGNAKEKPPCYTSSYDESNYKCDQGPFVFDVFTSKDIKWNYGNDTCIGYIVGTAVGLFTALAACRLMCPTPPSEGDKYAKLLDKIRQAQQSSMERAAEKAIETVKKASSGAGGGGSSVMAATSTVIDPFTIVELGIFAYRCTIPVQSAGCCPAATMCTAAYGMSIAVLAGIFGTAKNVFDNVRICGESHRVFVKDQATQIYSKTDGPYAKFLKKCFSGEDDKNNNIIIDYNKCHNNASYNKLCESQKAIGNEGGTIALCEKVSANPNNPSETKTINKKTKDNIYYREYLYRGIEYTDNGIGACSNPNWADAVSILGYSGGNQRYYMNGPQETPNYACSRFLAKGVEDEEGMKAYECCNKRSQESICLERYDGENKNYLFCSMNNRNCNVDFSALQPPVKYKVFESEESPRYICAKTYTVCPYDHNVAGGTDIPEIYKYRQGIVTNFCQYMRHCIKRPPLSKFQVSNPDTYFFAEACQNLTGDSQFISGLDTLKFSPIKSRNFSAPIVQCLKETLENNFMGKVGRNICKDNDSYYDYKGNCVSIKTRQITEVLYKKGTKIRDSSIKKIQNQLRNIVKFTLIFAVLFFGFQILLTVPEMHINKKTVSVFVVKIALVTFFALGEGWQSFFLDSILNVSTEISDITFQPKPINDGCNFPKYSHKEINDRRNGLIVQESQYDKEPISYPPGKNYLRIWDILDCKLARAIGYGPEVSSSNLAKMIFAGFLSGPLGITFFFAAFAYAFLLVSIILRSIQITIMSLLGIILLIYVSPITIACSLFEKTKGIFENWWKQLLGFILQPMILFAYLGLLLTIFDFIFIGDAKFETGASKYDMPSLSCNSWNDPITNSLKEPSKNSIYCILGFPKFKNYTGLELFDLAIPILTSLDKDKINVIFRAAILMFVFFNFLDKITFLAKKLVGGAELKADQGPDLKGKLKKFAKGAQERALNSSVKYGLKAAEKAKSSIRSRSSKDGNADTSKADGGSDSDNSGGGFASRE